ncbi:MAG: chlorite dismutase family protein [Planctomycetes bacterium]|nr:chlorite dismutase family protein [Planctomycetota bacterium]
MEGTKVEPRPEPAAATQTSPTYVDFLCYTIDPAFRRLDENARAGAAAEFKRLLKNPGGKLEIRPYLTAGFRIDCDFFLWLIAKDPVEFQTFTTTLWKAAIGTYLHARYAYLGVTKPSPYLPGHLQHFERGPATDPYAFIYPFTKTHEWYQLPVEKRRQMMIVHNEIGHKFPGVKINTTYQFGLGDYDFMLAFECADPKEFSDLVQRLRETEARLYTAADTPLIPGVKKTPEELIAALAL